VAGHGGGKQGRRYAVAKGDGQHRGPAVAVVSIRHRELSEAGWRATVLALAWWTRGPRCCSSSWTLRQKGWPHSLAADGAGAVASRVLGQEIQEGVVWSGLHRVVGSDRVLSIVSPASRAGAVLSSRFINQADSLAWGAAEDSGSASIVLSR